MTEHTPIITFDHVVKEFRQRGSGTDGGKRGTTVARAVDDVSLTINEGDIFGIIGYFVRKFDLNAAAIVLGLILGPIGENGLRRSLYLSDGDPTILFSTPLCWMLILLCVLGTCSPWLMARWEKHVEARSHH